MKFLYLYEKNKEILKFKTKLYYIYLNSKILYD